jgi:hypothetical protein
VKEATDRRVPRVKEAKEATDRPEATEATGHHVRRAKEATDRHVRKATGRHVHKAKEAQDPIFVRGRAGKAKGRGRAADDPIGAKKTAAREVAAVTFAVKFPPWAAAERPAHSASKNPLKMSRKCPISRVVGKSLRRAKEIGGMTLARLTGKRHLRISRRWLRLSSGLMNRVLFKCLRF